MSMGVEKRNQKRMKAQMRKEEASVSNNQPLKER